MIWASRNSPGTDLRRVKPRRNELRSAILAKRLLQYRAMLQKNAVVSNQKEGVGVSDEHSNQAVLVAFSPTKSVSGTPGRHNIADA